MKINQIFILLFLLFANVINTSLDHCDNPYWQFENYCQNCHDGYKLKEEDGTCIACESGKTGDDNYCFSTIENCERYELYVEGEICQECKIGYGLSEDFKKCTKCKDGEVSDGVKCFKEIEHCDEYHDDDLSCERCDENYYLKDNKCISCADNQRSNGVVCFDKIENCDSYYYERNSYESSDDGCFQCKTDKPNLTTGGTQCNTCEAEKYFFNNECIDEIKYCMEYSSKTECSRCKTGFQIKEGKCVPCADPYLSISDGKKCYLYHAFCEQHDYEGNCIYCVEGYSINSSKGCSKKNAGGLNIYNSFNFKVIIAVLLFIL